MTGTIKANQPPPPSNKRASKGTRSIAILLLAAGVCGIGFAVFGQGGLSQSADESTTEADLALIVQASADEAKPDRSTWIFTVTNQGPGVDEGPINLVATVPESFDPSSIKGSGWECADLTDAVSNEPSSDQDEPTLSLGCFHPEPLAARSSAVVELIGSSASGVDIEIDGAVSGTAEDLDLVDNVSWFALLGSDSLDNNGERSDTSNSGAESDDTSDTEVGAATEDSDEEPLPRTGPGITLALVWLGALFTGLGYLMLGWANDRYRSVSGKLSGSLVDHRN